MCRIITLPPESWQKHLHPRMRRLDLPGLTAVIEKIPAHRPRRYSLTPAQRDHHMRKILTNPAPRPQRLRHPRARIRRRRLGLQKVCPFVLGRIPGLDGRGPSRAPRILRNEMPKGQMPKGLAICPHLSAFPEMRYQGVRRQYGEEVWPFVLWPFVLSICPRWPS